MDSQGLVQSWDPGAEQLFGYLASEALGQPLGDLIVPEPIRPYHEAGLKRYRETRQGDSVGRRFELEALRKGGETVQIELLVKPQERDQQLTFEASVRKLRR